MLGNPTSRVLKQQVSQLMVSTDTGARVRLLLQNSATSLNTSFSARWKLLSLSSNTSLSKGLVLHSNAATSLQLRSACPCDVSSSRYISLWSNILKYSSL